MNIGRGSNEPYMNWRDSGQEDHTRVYRWSGRGKNGQREHTRGYQDRGRGRNANHPGYSRVNERGARSVESLHDFSRLRQNSDFEGRRRQGPKWQDDSRSKCKKSREHPISLNDLKRLTTLKPDVLILELRSERSGFSILVESDHIPTHKFCLTIQVLALVTTSPSLKESVYEFLNKTITENFATKLINLSLTLKRNFPNEASEVFSNLHTILETFCDGMMSAAITRLVNLVDNSCIVLETLRSEDYVKEDLIAQYKTLLKRLNEAAKKWKEEREMDTKELKRRRIAEMENMIPPDNFREMSVIPTPLDIQDSERPFLRRNIISGRYIDGAHYLDVQFRLLREDFVQPLRKGIKQLRMNTKSPITEVKVYRNVTYRGLKTERRSIFYQFHLGSLKTARLENSKRLLYGNLVCLSSDNFASMILGSVADRTLDSLKKGIIGIKLDTDITDHNMSVKFTMIESTSYFMVYKHVLQALKDMPDNVPMEKYIVQVASEVDPPNYLKENETYDMRVILDSTLMKKSEAFSKLFCYSPINKQEPQTYSSLQRVRVAYPLNSWPSANMFGLDESQRRALHGALTQELAIIQGPPGTGKTFIGLKIVQTLLHNSQVWKNTDNPTPILVVCYTNHALDQFLEGMMTFTNSIVRVGKRTQSEVMSKYQIKNLIKGVARERKIPRNIYHQNIDVFSELNKLEQRFYLYQEICSGYEAARGIFNLDTLTSKFIPDFIYKQLKVIEDEKQITHWLTYNYRLPNTPARDSQCDGSTSKKEASKEQGDNDENNEIDEDERNDYEEFLEREERDRMIDDDYVDFKLNASISPVYEVTKENLKSELAYWGQKRQDDENAYLNFIIKKAKLQALECGLAITFDMQNVLTLENQPYLNIWAIDPYTRWELYNSWVARLYENVKEKWKTDRAKYEQKLKVQEEIKNAEYLFAMREAAVIGMTTTGAAQYSKILLDLQPAIVIVEEAAEILESHVMTSLTSSCQHLIMIGDHQQLKPSTTVYELAKKYNLETSLFERLIKNNLPFNTLEYQHRMRPSISKLLVPSIYPHLKDHSSVEDYPPVLGITQNVFFITHQELEKEEADDNRSHENQHEAELMIGLCRHLRLQGYAGEDITILTTYTGQLFLLKRLQRKDPICSNVRVCVVDNFQGEESKIILLSLVRSNVEGKVGFLSINNRVCVALSRAKYGLYITGNMDILSKSSSLWKNIKADLSKSGSLGEALSLQCENHPDQISAVSTAKDFQAKSPEGGCLLMCNKSLPRCKHSCQRVCHMNDPEHSDYICRVSCPKILCDLDHRCPKLCGEACDPCIVMVEKLLPCHHRQTIACHIHPNSYECPTVVNKVLPLCGHMANMPCHKNPTEFLCPEDCYTRLDCGHKCKKKCHRAWDPDHQEYNCLEQCTRVNTGCSQNHPCMKKCHEECGSCTVLVNKKLPCGHEVKGVECSQPLEEINCRKKCKKTLPCGHSCKKLCYKNCGECDVMVKKVVATCRHTVAIPCSKPATSEVCDGQCPKTLSCGHPCLAKCKDKCTAVKCSTLVLTANICPKGHHIELPCHLKDEVNGDAAWKYCKEPCNKILDCDHICGGKCGDCLQGRLHQPCNQPCEKPLVCGHVCKYPCGLSCPPCQEQCRWKCNHSKCCKKCGIPCEPCKERCESGCKHSKCSNRCGEKCSRNPCYESCPEKLKCGHMCVGFCGDPCPPLCRICDRAQLTEFVILCNEEEEDARFVWLEDCGHCIEVEGLEGWIEQYKGGGHEIVSMMACPRCKHPIYNNRRYQNLVLETYRGVQEIKKKYYKKHNVKIADIEMILQDPECLNLFQSEGITILKRMGMWNRKKGNYFEQMSVEEKALCHFQAQVLKKATNILKPQFTSSLDNNSIHMERVKPMVLAVVARVMEKTITISHQMKEEVSCELQRLLTLPTYWSFLEKAAVYNSPDMHNIQAQLKVLMNPTVRYDEELDRKIRTLLEKSQQYIGGLGIPKSDTIQIMNAMGLHQGHWYKCPKGHIYCITECGRAMQESTCPECGSKIGGGSHRLRSDNTEATEMFV